MTIDRADELPNEVSADAIVCVTVGDIELTEQSWNLILAEWKRRRATGWRGYLDEDEVMEIINGGSQS